MAADDNYNAATSVSFPVTLVKATQPALILTVPASITYGATGTASTTGGAGTGARTFSAGTSTGCSVDASSGVISVTNASNTCSISASKAGDDNYDGPVSDGPKPVTLNKATQAALILTVPASITFGATGMATTTGGTGTGARTFSAGTSTGCSVNGATGVISVTNASGTCAISASKVGDDNYIGPVSDGPKSVLLNKATPGVTVTVSPAPVQYSDQVTYSATVTGVPSGAVTGTVQFKLNGTNVGSPVTLAGGVASLGPLQVLVGPGTPPVTGVYSGDGNYATQTGSTTLTVNPEDSRATYSGMTEVGGASSSATTAAVTLGATIQDITALDATNDPSAGDIRNAKVSFYVLELGQTVCSNLSVTLVSASDPKTGTTTCTWTAPIPTAGYQTYTVRVDVGGYYTAPTTGDAMATVNVYQPQTSSFITGGGYLVLSSSSGQYAGAPGSRNNFGFNVKYNKSGTNLQGNINSIVRNNGHVYQIKGNSMTSLAVTPSTGCLQATSGSPCTATFSGKASILDITNPNNIISVMGNATLQVTMTDKGEPGSSDTIGITVWNGSGQLWFSSNWTTKTVEQLLAGGNIVVH
jgi:hypothetical protein